MENDDDVVLDESDEIPFVDTWGYCLIGCFTGPFPVKVVVTPVVPSPAVPPKFPVVDPVPVVNPEPVIPPRVTRSKARVKARDNAPSKVSLPKMGINIANGSLPEANESVDMITSPSNKGKGSKGVDKGKAIVSQIPVVTPNSFEALNVMGGTRGTHDEDVTNVQMGDLVPSASENTNQDDEGGGGSMETRNTKG
ncbi:hypothetical protein LIER_42482 [Lithospermum erythrorhizon]|uniref:Uncharacterized protein n=1 Tax=Lithospermum erythrorhizon TaxID=34254 RepID=A0AAV3RSM9_LITER